jgi:hypothetical protein
MYQKRITKKFILIIIFLITYIGFTFPSLGQFSAEFIQKSGSGEVVTKLYVHNPFYRMEFEEAGRKGIVLVDTEGSISKVLMPEQKMYMEIKSEDPRQLMRNPFQALDYFKSTGAVKNIGKETINGYVCDKYIIQHEGKDIMTQWFSEKLQFAIKIINHSDEDMVLELRNIKEGPQDPSLFKVPEDYQKMDMSGMPVDR